MKKLMVLLAMICLDLIGAGFSEASVTMKFPTGTTVFYDRDGSAVRPDASGNATAPASQIVDYLLAGFSPYSDYLNEGSNNLFYTNARARAAISSSATGLTYTGGTGVFSLTSGYVLPRSTHPEDVAALAAAEKAAASGVASLDGSSKVVQDPANATATPTASKIPIADGSGTLNGWYTPTTPITSYAAGTAYALTATPAQAVFGTTSPAVTVTSAGTWAIRYRGHVKYTGATFAANQTATLKLRRTNNTAADLANSPATAITDIVTAATGTLAWVEGEVIYTTANTDDVIQVWGSVSDVPGAGSLDVVEANIIAVATK